jgi:hypothetical protein
MIRLEFVKDGTSQKLWFAAKGRPSATPSVGIKDSGGSIIVASGTTNVTLDPVSTTLSAQPSVGDKTISLTSVADLRINAEYRLTNSDTGEYEDVQIRSLANPVKLAAPLEKAYSSTATNNTFASREFYYTLQAADVDTLDELFVATATYAVTGEVTQPLLQTFDVVLHPLQNPLGAASVRKWHPDLTEQEWEEQRGDDYAEQRVASFDKVLRRIRRHGFRPAAIVTSEDIFDWVLAEFRLACERGGIRVMRDIDKLEALRILKEEADAEGAEALRSIKFLDDDESEAIGEEEEEPVRMDLMR